MVHNVGCDTFKLCCLVEEIGSLSMATHVVSFIWCLCEANGAVHLLAHVAMEFGNFELSFVNLSSSFS